MVEGSGIGLLEVAGEVEDAEVIAGGGIGVVNVRGAVRGSSLTTDDPTDPSRGRIGSLTAGKLTGVTIRAASAGTVRVVGGPDILTTVLPWPASRSAGRSRPRRAAWPCPG